MAPRAEPTVIAAEPASAGEGAREVRLLTSDDTDSNHPRWTISEVDSPPGSDGSVNASAAARWRGARGTSQARLTPRFECAATWKRRPIGNSWSGAVWSYLVGGTAAASYDVGHTVSPCVSVWTDTGAVELVPCGARSRRTPPGAAPTPPAVGGTRSTGVDSVERWTVAVGRSGRVPTSGASSAPSPRAGDA